MVTALEMRRMYRHVGCHAIPIARQPGKRLREYMTATENEERREEDRKPLKKRPRPVKTSRSTFPFSALTAYGWRNDA
jgi:hypothetical protein